MKKSRFTDEQIAYAMKQAETGTPVAEVIRRMGISEQTFYRWKKLYGGLGVGELRRLKQLEDENRQLKRLVADLSLDKHILQDVLTKIRSHPDSFSAKASSLLGRTEVLNTGSKASIRKYLRIVFRDNPVRRSISQIGIACRNRQRRITLNKSMLITPHPPTFNQSGFGSNMGQISVKIYATTGSLLSGNQHDTYLLR